MSLNLRALISQKDWENQNFIKKQIKKKKKADNYNYNSYSFFNDDNDTIKNPTTTTNFSAKLKKKYSKKF